MIVLSTAITPELIIGLKGLFGCKSSSTIELKASPDGSIPTRLKASSMPRTSSALQSEMTFEMDWMVKRMPMSPSR